jgi:HlyD family secretion protein
VSLSKLQTGSDPLDIQSQQLAVQQRVNALTDARETLADYTVRAQFDGVITSVSVHVGDVASSGAAIATLVTQQQVATISMNEVDVAKVAVGQKVNLTFDAVSDLSMTGSVAEIDAIGTVSQGVVTYNVKIGLDMQDERVKPGMSVSAVIVTNVHPDVLTVPNVAIKSQGTSYYVEIIDQPGSAISGSQGVTAITPPRQQSVEIGLANDTSTEIISGLSEDTQVVMRTISSNTTQVSATQAPSLFGATGARGGATSGAALRGAVGR